MPSNRIKAKGHKLKHGRLRLNMRRHFFSVRVTEYWNRLTREVVESSSLKIFKTHLNAILHNVL